MNQSYAEIAKAGTYQAVAHRLAEGSECRLGAILADNRHSAAIQKKQFEAMAASRPVQWAPNNTGLPDQLKSGIESLSGHSMDDVKVHYNSAMPAQLNAHAYAQGTDIHIAAGQEKHLPHEAWHVVQQKQGRVKPTVQMKGKVNINDDKRLEKEADVMGAKATQVNIANHASDENNIIQGKHLPGGFTRSGKTIQRALTELNDDSVKGETRNQNVILRVDGADRYTEMGEDLSLRYIANTDQYTMADGIFWDPVTEAAFEATGNNVYRSMDGQNYNYVRGRYVPVGQANIGAEPALDPAMHNFIQQIWGARGNINALQTPREKMNYIYKHFYAFNGGIKNQPNPVPYAIPLIRTMVDVSRSWRGMIQFGVDIPLAADPQRTENIEDPSRLFDFLETGTDPQKRAAYQGLAYKYYYFRLSGVPGSRRIIINTAPSQTASEFIKVFRILDGFRDVARDIKVAGPLGAALKMDSIIIYANGVAPNFLSMIDALKRGGVATVNQLPAMVSQLEPGIGYAHEPAPVGHTAISFGEKRVILAFMALERSSTLQQFTFLTGQFFEDAGIDTGRAHAEKNPRSNTVLAHLRAYLTVMSGR